MTTSQIDREAARLAWQALLNRQQAERDTLKDRHEAEREALYRDNKQTFNELTSEH